MARIATFIGTRPEAIKMAPVIRALQSASDFDPVVVSTGQHREMLQQVVDLFDLPVHERLDVMRPNQTLAGLTSRLVAACDEVLERIKPDYALVQGDTTTVLAASLCCFYRRIPLGHVEAGLRTGNLQAPFPEEANRVLAGRLADLHFAPTEQGRRNLLREGVEDARILVTGNPVIDALELELERQRRPEVRSEIDAALASVLGPENRHARFVLVTGHRRENFGDGFLEICNGLAQLAERFPDHLIVYPVHLNPNVGPLVHQKLGMLPNVRLVAPQPYSTFVALMNACVLILTDSGGVQEEGPSLGKPVLVMRDTTERPEAVEAGTVKLTGANAHRIVTEASILLSDAEAYRRMAGAINPYGDGQAARRIVEAIRKRLRP